MHRSRIGDAGKKNTSWILTSYGKLGLLRVYTAEVRTEGSQTGTNKVGKICTSSLRWEKRA